MLRTNPQVCGILEKSEEIALEFYKESFVRIHKWLNTIK